MRGLVHAFLLQKPVDIAALEVLRCDIASAVDSGERDLTIDIDDVGILESYVIAALLAILRSARERGASISLCASRPNLLDSLRVTALDKVFTIVTCEDVRPPVPRAPVPKRGGVRPSGRFVAAFFAGAMALGSIPFGARAAVGVISTPAPEEILKSVVAQNGDLPSYRARVGVDFRLRSFPYASQHLDGTTYYKRPNNFEVVFEKVPSYAKGFDKLYGDIDDPTSWSRRFDVTYAGERNVNGHRDYVLRLVQKVRGMIDHQDVAIDPASWRVDSMEWHYYNGGTIAMSQEYERVGTYTVLARQHATIRIPLVHAAAEAVYHDYQTNVPIDDSVFTGEKKR